jgi:hypothetical protein
VAVFLGGCTGVFDDLPVAGDAPPGAVVSNVDFSRITPLAKAALDLTDRNAGLISDETFHRRHREAADVQLHEVGPTTYALLFEIQGHAQVIALSGTTSIENNVYNLNVELVTDPVVGGAVHAGYRELALLILDDVRLRLRPDQPVTLVGFSQGGAVAALLPLWLLANGWSIDQIITLGQPKVTDAGFAGRLALLPVIRLISGDDVIPGYPRAAGYSHFGRAIELLDGPYIVSVSPGEPGYADPRELPDELPDFLGLDHGTYDLRLAGKVGRTVYELPPY